MNNDVTSGDVMSVSASIPNASLTEHSELENDVGNFASKRGPVALDELKVIGTAGVFGHCLAIRLGGALRATALI